MNTSFTMFSPVLSSVLAACLLSVQPAAAAEKVAARTVPAKTTRSTSVVSNEIPVIEIPQSTFVADFSDRKSRDPFYPSATYINNIRPKVFTPIGKPPDDGNEVLKGLRVTGSGGVEGRRWAMINGMTIHVGEAATVPVGGKAYKVECIELSDKSVTVGIKGSNARRELKFE